MKTVLAILCVIASIVPALLATAGWLASVDQCPGGNDCEDARAAGMLGTLLSLALLTAALLLLRGRRAEESR